MSLSHGTMCKAGVRGICSWILLRSLEMASTPIQMTASSGHTLTLAIQHVQSTVKHLIAVRARITVLPLARLVCIARKPKRFARMRTASVSCTLGEENQADHRLAAFDDQTSTFIIPSGPGFEVVFCPAGRSSTIIKSMSSQRTELARYGLSQKLLRDASNMTLVAAQSVGSVSAFSTMVSALLLPLAIILSHFLQGLP